MSTKSFFEPLPSMALIFMAAMSFGEASVMLPYCNGGVNPMVSAIVNNANHHVVDYKLENVVCAVSDPIEAKSL